MSENSYARMREALEELAQCDGSADNVSADNVSDVSVLASRVRHLAQTALSSTAAPDMPPPGKPFVGCQCPNCGEEFAASAAPAPVAGDAVSALPAFWRIFEGVGRNRCADELEAALAQDRASQPVRIGIDGRGDSPTRFVAFSSNDEIIAAGTDPRSVQDMAQDYAEAHKGEYVHLYQHAMSLRCSDGD